LQFFLKIQFQNFSEYQNEHPKKKHGNCKIFQDGPLLSKKHSAFPGSTGKDLNIEKSRNLKNFSAF
jgi:hypothetical protein